jgi:alkylation response protein AidB-like acyl-CoA dehydrogenase
MSEDLDLVALADSVADVLGDRFDKRRLHAFVDGDAAIGEGLRRDAAELGWLAIGLSEDAGGLGLGLAGLSAVQIEYGRALAPGAEIATAAAAALLDEIGTDAVRAQLGEVAAGALQIAVPAVFGDVRAAFGGSGIDIAATRMLGSPDAAWMLVETGGDGGRGLALIDAQAATSTPVSTWDRTQSTFRLEGSGLVQLLSADGAACDRLESLVAVLLASDSLGGGLAILDQTIDYLKTREQFGKPIGTFQALKHRVADMSVLLRTGRSLLDQAIAADGGPAAYLWAALAKASLTDAYRAVAADCLQLHGGIGFTWEHECHLHLKRARLNEALLRPNGPLRDRAADELVRLAAEGRDVMEIVE